MFYLIFAQRWNITETLKNENRHDRCVFISLTANEQMVTNVSVTCCQMSLMTFNYPAHSHRLMFYTQWQTNQGIWRNQICTILRFSFCKESARVTVEVMERGPSDNTSHRPVNHTPWRAARLHRRNTDARPSAPSAVRHSVLWSNVAKRSERKTKVSVDLFLRQNSTNARELKITKRPHKNNWWLTDAHGSPTVHLQQSINHQSLFI